jgi:hypothetical protein
VRSQGRERESSLEVKKYPGSPEPFKIVLAYVVVDSEGEEAAKVMLVALK